MGTPVGLSGVVVLVVVVLFWLFDAVLMQRLKQGVATWNDSCAVPNEVTARLRICVVSSVTGIVLYFIRLILEIATSAVVAHDLRYQAAGYAITAIFAALKIMRVVAVKSFGKWLATRPTKAEP